MATTNLEPDIKAIKKKLDENKMAAAEKDARALLKKNPKAASAHAILGRVLMLKGDMPGSEVEERKAVELDPRYPEGHWYLGLALQQQNKVQEAVGHYNTALKLKPKLRKEKGCSDCSWVKQLNQ